MNTDKIIEKFSKIGLFDNENINQSTQSSNIYSFNTIVFPTIKRVMSTTISGGGWIKSKKQKLKENRINKLRKVQGLDPNVTLPEDEYVEGLISVQPLSAPILKNYYIDYIYEANIENRII